MMALQNTLCFDVVRHQEWLCYFSLLLLEYYFIYIYDTTLLLENTFPPPVQSKGPIFTGQRTGHVTPCVTTPDV